MAGENGTGDDEGADNPAVHLVKLLAAIQHHDSHRHAAAATAD